MILPPQPENHPRPEPSRGEVRIRVRATAINRADLPQRLPKTWTALKGLEHRIDDATMRQEMDRVSTLGTHGGTALRGQCDCRRYRLGGLQRRASNRVSPRTTKRLGPRPRVSRS